jgi:hypothetical protein
VPELHDIHCEKVGDFIRLHARDPDGKASSTHRNHAQLQRGPGSSPSQKETGKDWTGPESDISGPWEWDVTAKIDLLRVRAPHGTGYPHKYRHGT